MVSLRVLVLCSVLILSLVLAKVSGASTTTSSRSSRTKLNTATSELDMTTSKLEMSTPKLKVTTPKMERATSEVDKTTSKLDITTSKKDKTTSKVDTPTHAMGSFYKLDKDFKDILNYFCYGWMHGIMSGIEKQSTYSLCEVMKMDKTHQKTLNVCSEKEYTIIRGLSCGTTDTHVTRRNATISKSRGKFFDYVNEELRTRISTTCHVGLIGLEDTKQIPNDQAKVCAVVKKNAQKQKILALSCTVNEYSTIKAVVCGSPAALTGSVIILVILTVCHRVL
ncbi:uncharacterized protein LOC101861323 [Aplysia californica]|uniref:Uncharacterized protein LOC101861323 n=1 Tax=Aplysia californica TaxID=6500 RepID=A0ABM0K693_APLCA|nr:uncharacterized protein LOC101861323 [Aplysia californica]XP_005109704.1 uncharacterized protein LOC101861323 [Aplysia californica]XP_005109706.1 uncharacterized protein LOC101861323 [Aplysia californica]